MVAALALGLRISRNSSGFLAFGFLGQFTFEPPLFSGFHIERMFPDLLEDTFLLDPSLETTHRALDRFALKNPNFGQKCASCKIRSPAVSKGLKCGENTASMSAASSGNARSHSHE